MKAISQGQGRATELLMRMAKRDVDLGAAAPDRLAVLGMPRKRIMCSSSRPRGKVMGKKVEQLRATTANRSRAKDAEGIWTGFSRTPVRLRRKEGVVTVDMIAAPQQQPKPPPNRGGRQRMKLAKKNIRNLAAPRGEAKAKKSKMTKTAYEVVVVDVSDLSGLEPGTGGNYSSAELSKWIDVVARGGVAKVKSSSGGFVIQRHSSTMTILKANLSCTAKIVSNHW